MIYIVCGVPGSGKTWVLSHLEKVSKDTSSRVSFVHHDDFIGRPDAFRSEILRWHLGGDHVVADCPLQVRGLLATISAIPVFVIPDPVITAAQYEYRERRAIPKQHLGRIPHMRKLASDYGAFVGDSTNVLKHLKEVLFK